MSIGVGSKMVKVPIVQPRQWNGGHKLQRHCILSSGADRQRADQYQT